MVVLTLSAIATPLHLTTFSSACLRKQPAKATSLHLLLTTLVPSYIYATSPQDFWGRRLDLAFQRLLKRSFFYPVRVRIAGATGSALAAMATFAASGVVHEALWYCMGMGLAAGAEVRLAPAGADRQGCVADGWTTAYFLLQGLLCAAGTVVAAVMPPWLVARVPGPVKLYVALVCGPLLGLPWYLGRLTACGYWAGLAELYPTVQLGPLARARLEVILPARVLGLPRELLLHCAVVVGCHLLWPPAPALPRKATAPMAVAVM